MSETVMDLVAESEYSRIWLCPSIVSNRKYSDSELLQGIDCSKSTVPELLKQMNVKKHFVEDDQLCIIWDNDGGKIK